MAAAHAQPAGMVPPARCVTVDTMAQVALLVRVTTAAAVMGYMVMAFVIAETTGAAFIAPPAKAAGPG